VLDEITDLFYSLKPAYRRRAVWVMNDTTIKMLAKIKTGVASDNRYIWRENLQGPEPPTLLGRPVVSAYEMPNPTTGLAPVAFGDFSYFWIAERAGTQIQRLNERYAELGLIGVRGMRRIDSELTQAEAIKKLVMA
jgi:HK97 family phage major capsid protein